jgi:hypothetical protein
VHLKVVASLLGHRTIQVMLDSHSHVTPGLAREARRALVGLVANRTANHTAQGANGQ